MPDFARTVRAHAALERGDIESALRLLEGLNLEPHYGGTYRSPFFTQLHTRFLLAEVLLAAGRDAELRPLVDEAERQLACLTGERAAP